MRGDDREEVETERAATQEKAPYQYVSEGKRETWEQNLRPSEKDEDEWRYVSDNARFVSARKLGRDLPTPPTTHPP